MVGEEYRTMLLHKVVGMRHPEKYRSCAGHKGDKGYGYPMAKGKWVSTREMSGIL